DGTAVMWESMSSPFFLKTLIPKNQGFLFYKILCFIPFLAKINTKTYFYSTYTRSDARKCDLYIKRGFSLLQAMLGIKAVFICLILLIMAYSSKKTLSQDI
ncbi:hypothetical protein, partial [Flavobacterium sp. Leaf82]|uniref:hypothetical protein n=1 Tax=Flavobacterium sp. Leaf82 TaxID=1736238 RepID=UPI0019D71882